MSDYILDLRKIVGHRPLMQVGASVIPEDAAGRVLLERRRDNGQWGYPGGSVELFEDTEDAARRELFEETGLSAESLELFGVFSGPALRYVYPNGDEVSNVDVVYVCREFSGEPLPQQEEVGALAWFAADALPPEEELSPPIRIPLLSWAKKRTEGIPPVKSRTISGQNRTFPLASTRDGCRGIVIRDGKILLIHETVTGWFLLPGGGLEIGETHRACCEREIAEETGFLAEAVRPLLTLHEFYGDCRYESRYFLCRVVGETKQRLTGAETARGVVPVWLPLEEALGIFSAHESFRETDEERRGSYLREYTAISEILASGLIGG